MRLKRDRAIREHFLFKGKRTQKRSRELSPRIARQRDRVHEEVEQEVANSIKDLEPRSVLDVGTGYGVNARLLMDYFGKSAQIWSVDASPRVVREVKRIMRQHQHSRHVVFKQANAEKLPFKNGRFDLLVSVFLIHHLSDVKRGLREMGRVTSDKGKMIIADWRPIRSPVTPHAHSDMPSPSSILRHIKRLGYSTKIRKGRYWYLIEVNKREG